MYVWVRREINDAACVVGLPTVGALVLDVRGTHDYKYYEESQALGLLHRKSWF